MPYAIDTVGGKKQVIGAFRRHYEALKDIQASVDNGTPLQCVKAQDQEKQKHGKEKKKHLKEKIRKKRFQKNKKNDLVRKTQKSIRNIKKSKRSKRIDNNIPKSFYKSSSLTSARRRREFLKQQEHERRLIKMQRQMQESHTFKERKKNKYDTVANPVKLFRRVMTPDCDIQCLSASSKFLGRLKISNEVIRLMSPPKSFAVNSIYHDDLSDDDDDLYFDDDDDSLVIENANQIRRPKSAMSVSLGHRNHSSSQRNISSSRKQTRRKKQNLRPSSSRSTAAQQRKFYSSRKSTKTRRSQQFLKVTGCRRKVKKKGRKQKKRRPQTALDLHSLSNFHKSHQGYLKKSKVSLRTRSAGIKKKRIPSSRHNRKKHMSDPYPHSHSNLINNQMIDLQNIFVHHIEQNNLNPEEICEYLSKQIANNLILHFDEAEILQMAQYLCTEFGVSIAKLRFLLSTQLSHNQHSLDDSEDSDLQIPYTSRRQPVNIPMPKNEFTDADIRFSSPEPEFPIMSPKDEVEVLPKQEAI